MMIKTIRPCYYVSGSVLVPEAIVFVLTLDREVVLFKVSRVIPNF